MSVIENGELTQTSVSQVELFQNCQRAWWFQSAHYLKPDSSAAAIAGDAGHNLLALHLRGGELPKRAQMLKAVTGAILKGELPTPGPDLRVELRGDGQEKFSKYTCECRHPNSSHAEGLGACSEPGCECQVQKPLWIPLLKATTLWIGGVPWELFIDLTHRRGDRPVVLDHKFKSKDLLHTAKQGHELIDTVQMPVYVRAMMREWSDAREWEIVHHYIARTGVESFMRRAVVTVDQVLEREASIAKTVGEMKLAASAKDQSDVPFKRSWCEKGPIGLGCPHQSICQAFRRNQMEQLSEAEKKMLDGLDDLDPVPAEAPKRKLPPIVDVVEEDEEAKAKREFDERMKRIAADKAAKAKAEADAKVKAEAEKKPVASPPIPDSLLPDPKATAGQPDPVTAKGPATVTVTVSLDVFDKIRAFLK